MTFVAEHEFVRTLNMTDSGLSPHACAPDYARSTPSE